MLEWQPRVQILMMALVLVPPRSRSHAHFIRFRSFVLTKSSYVILLLMSYIQNHCTFLTCISEYYPCFCFLKQCCQNMLSQDFVRLKTASESDWENVSESIICKVIYHKCFSVKQLCFCWWMLVYEQLQSLQMS